MPRLFIGIEIPEHCSNHLTIFRGGLSGARWIDKENYHITLRFIGDIDDRTGWEIAQSLHAIHRKSFELTLDGLGSFGKDKPRALFANVKQNHTLSELQADIERRISRLSTSKDTRKFTPHVTLARLKETSAREVADYIALRGYFAPLTFTVSRFVLFSSRDSVGGGPYITEEVYNLVP